MPLKSAGAKFLIGTGAETELAVSHWKHMLDAILIGTDLQFLSAGWKHGLDARFSLRSRYNRTSVAS